MTTTIGISGIIGVKGVLYFRSLWSLLPFIDTTIVPRGRNSEAILTASFTRPPPLLRRSIINLFIPLSFSSVSAVLKSENDLSVKSLSKI